MENRNQQVDKKNKTKKKQQQQQQKKPITQLTDWRILLFYSSFFSCGGGSSLTFMRLHTDIKIARNYFGQIRRNGRGNINARNN